MNYQERKVGFWRRSLAALIDTILLTLIIWPVFTIVYGESYWSSGYTTFRPIELIMDWVFPFIATLLFWRFRQATPGKMIIRSKIVDEETGGPPTMRQWIIRYIGYFVAGIPLGVGILWVAFDRNKQGWHDYLAKTIVVTTQETEQDVDPNA